MGLWLRNIRSKQRRNRNRRLQRVLGVKVKVVDSMPKDAALLVPAPTASPVDPQPQPVVIVNIEEAINKVDSETAEGRAIASDQAAGSSIEPGEPK